MVKTKVFISFDYDNDRDIKELLVGQARNEDSPFEIIDLSVKEAIAEDWKSKVRTKIKSVDQVIVLCGKFTNKASGVATELSITQEESKPYFLLAGRSNDSVKPLTAKSVDKVYEWTWDNIKKLLEGRR